MTEAALPRGVALLQDPRLNKSTAFTEEERHALGLRGLLPARVFTLEEQVGRILHNFERKPSDLERYIYLIGLQDRNETLFYRTLVDHIERMMPIVYTPTVGEACRVFGHIFRRPRGLYVTAEDRGRVRRVLANWPDPVEVIVATDGERILGLGDLGANGMGIPIGKLSLYTACGGVHPAGCLPVTLDVGTDHEALRRDPLYNGLRRPRLRGAAYAELLEEFVTAVADVFPGALVQWEDFATDNAFRLLERYRDRVPSFNDDIQGTAAVTLAGLLSSGRITGRSLAEERLLFLGAGAAATGIAGLVLAAMVRRGVDEEEARRRSWFVDSTGLVTAGREGLPEHKRPYAHPWPPPGGPATDRADDGPHGGVPDGLPDLLVSIRGLRPTTLIGVSGQGGAFTPEVLRAMAELHRRPVIMALSNPTANAECTAEEAYRHTEGRAVFASGSPFDPVELDGRPHVPGQANNVYIFPGLGLGAVASGARAVTEDMFHAAATALAEATEASELERGSLFPPLPRIREVSARIAAAVAGVAWRRGLAAVPEPEDDEAHVRARMYEPVYRPYV